MPRTPLPVKARIGLPPATLKPKSPLSHRIALVTMKAESREQARLIWLSALRFFQELNDGATYPTPQLAVSGFNA
jgi:hypothetical protein